MQLKQIYTNVAPIILAIGLVSIFDRYIPGLSVPGDSMTWMAAAIACALVAKA